MEENRLIPDKPETRLYLNRKDFPKFTSSVKFGSTGELAIQGRIKSEDKWDKEVSKSIETLSIDGEKATKEEEDEDKVMVSPSFSIPKDDSDEYKDFHYGDNVNLTASYEVVSVSDNSITLKLKNITPKITRRIGNV